jgi:hypothetical protein
MTVDRLEGELHGTDPRGAAALPVSSIVSVCDELLGEASRRRHLFAWLRAPGSGAEEWLPVDAYYPRSRVVLVCRDEPTEDDQLYRELVPRNGLRLLVLAPSELGRDRASAKRALGEMIATLEPAHGRGEPERPVETRPDGRVALTPAAAQSSPATTPRRTRSPASATPSRQGRRAHRLGRSPTRARWPTTGVRAQRRPRPSTAGGPSHVRRRSGTTPRPSPVRATALESSWVVAGLALAFAIAAELYVAVVVVALGAGRVWLGGLIALDALVRVGGAVAAERAGSKGWSWACVIGGAPVVVLFALTHRHDRVRPVGL